MPEPDWWEFQLPPGQICLITDDGSPLTGQLAQRLTQQGWQVVVLSFLPFLTPHTSFPSELKRVVLEETADLPQQLNAIATEYGTIAGFIHLHPYFCAADRDSEHTMLKQVFLLAKYLKPSLTQAAQIGNSCFFTVVHLDGVLGVSGDTQFSPLAGGLCGLTKALRWEWQGVFCRSLDLSPELDPATAVTHILAELHDPNRLVADVGYNSQGRSTLVC